MAMAQLPDMAQVADLVHHVHDPDLDQPQRVTLCEWRGESGTLRSIQLFGC